VLDSSTSYFLHDQAWTTSFGPFVLTTHQSQEGKAFGTILWKHALETRRDMDEPPNEVPWSSLIELIDLRFQSLTDERRGLTDDNKPFNKTKLFG